MKVSSTEIQNNFGKYLILAGKEDIIITKNGTEVARLTAGDSIIKQKGILDGIIREEAPEYYITGDFGGRRATYEEYLELTNNDKDARYEYIDGEIYLLSSPKTAHQTALTELFGIFYNWFQGKKCRPMVAPYDITLSRRANNINVVQPDLMVICDLEEKLGRDGYYKGTPALIVEIFSESTSKKDRVKKFDLYLDCGVREYWLVNPRDKQISVFHFNEGNITDRQYNGSEIAGSYIFKGLKAELGRVFR